MKTQTVKHYPTKSYSGGMAIKDVDTKKGIVEGFFSAFDVVDSDNDMIMPGAFKKSIQENGPDSDKPRIKHLFMHDPAKPIGKLESLEETKFGLKFISTMSKSTLGQDVLMMYQEGIITEHSIGFNTVQEEKSDDEIAHNKLIELKLWEGSGVTWGANEYTPVVGVKSKFKTPEDFIDAIDKIKKALENGRYSDEGFVGLQIKLSQLQDAMSSLQAEPADLSDHHSDESEPIEDTVNQLSYFQQSLNKRLRT